MSTKYPDMNKHCLIAFHSGNKPEGGGEGGGEMRTVSSAHNSIPQMLLLKTTTILYAEVLYAYFLSSRVLQTI